MNWATIAKLVQSGADHVLADTTRQGAVTLIRSVEPFVTGIKT